MLKKGAAGTAARPAGNSKKQQKAAKSSKKQQKAAKSSSHRATSETTRKGEERPLDDERRAVANLPGMLDFTPIAKRRRGENTLNGQLIHRLSTAWHRISH
ncbi:hypothetical protein OVY01_17865 [Robbsia sp. Bb-Pol-6]|uniref:Uncharacterized protein n=1 Tax=Robbsia betulipollinis TaxID=2981849 RepID=A0ABT3ZRA8_9BURK|nr:hypothetical protein [Robbsia betulipollinis]MCY0389022.1 hypothetical protein [Robbsia betulipollinis]